MATDNDWRTLLRVSGFKTEKEAEDALNKIAKFIREDPELRFHTVTGMCIDRERDKF